MSRQSFDSELGSDKSLILLGLLTRSGMPNLEGSRWLPFYFSMAREFDSNFSEGLDSIFDTQPGLVKHSASQLCGLQTTY